MILVEILTNSKGQQLYLEKIAIDFSPSQGYFSLNKVPESLLELL